MNPLNWTFRQGFAVVALICAAFLAFAYYAQFQMHLEPCPLCIFQRVAFIALFLVALIGALHDPKATGRKAYGALAALSAIAGASIATRHVWIQHLPPDQVPDCGPGLDYMLDAFPLSKTLKMVFTGSGECAKIDWTFLSLSMPEWTLIWFAIFIAVVSYYGFRRYAT